MIKINLCSFIGLHPIYMDILLIFQDYYQKQGHDVVISDHQLQDDRVNLLFATRDFHEVLRSCQGRIIIVNLEQLFDQNPWLSEFYRRLLHKYEVWDYNQTNAQWIFQKFKKPVSIIQLGYCSLLETVPLLSEDQKDIDVLFYGTLNHRRQYIQQACENHPSIKKVIFRRTHESERDHLIARSKIILNLHYYPIRLLEIVRVNHLLCNHAFVISETCSNQEEYKYLEGGLIFAPYHHIVETIVHWLQHPEERRQIAEQGYQNVRATPVRLPSLENGGDVSG